MQLCPCVLFLAFNVITSVPVCVCVFQPVIYFLFSVCSKTLGAGIQHNLFYSIIIGFAGLFTLASHKAPNETGNTFDVAQLSGRIHF